MDIQDCLRHYPVVPIKLEVAKEELENIASQNLSRFLKKMQKLYEAKEAEFPEPEQIREIERIVLLKVIDRKWMDHIDDMDQLRQVLVLWHTVRTSCC